MMNNVYKESQSFLAVWLIILFGFLFLMQVYQVYTGFLEDGVWSFNLGFWIFCLVLFGFLVMRLHTKIDEDGITIRFMPFIRNKSWAWEEVTEVRVVTYSLLDYGGWGYRVGSKGVAYTTRGKYGIQLLLKNGQKFLIGTQHPQAIEKMLAVYYKETNEK